MKKSWELKTETQLSLKSLHVHVRNYRAIFVQWFYLMQLIKTILQLQIVSYYQSFTGIWKNMDLRIISYCKFQGQFEGVLDAIEKMWFTELLWSKSKT